MQERIKHLEMRLRALAPLSVRRAYRLARALKPYPSSQSLTPDLLLGCTMVASRFALLEVLPKGGTVAELGTLKGDFARAIMQCNAPKTLHVVDLDYSQFNDAGLTAANVRRHLGLTHDVMATFPDATFDWVYIDADHSYDGVLRDARAAAAKVKPGGYAVFNDFAHIDPGLGRYGVHRAVVDFALEARWPLAYFAYEVSGLYDVALRRPAASTRSA